MTISPEARKIYNKRYYEKNRDKILESLSQKEVCPKCGASVTEQHLSKHQETDLCKRRRSEYKKKQKEEKLESTVKDEIELLKKQIKKLNEKVKRLSDDD